MFFLHNWQQREKQNNTININFEESRMWKSLKFD